VTRLALALALAAILLIAMALGWAGHWAVARRRRDSDGLDARLAETAAKLHAVEVQRDALLRRAEAAEAALAAEREEAGRRLAAALAGTQAELAVAMDAIGDARRDAEAWRRAYEGLVGEDRDDP
jgi:hypothetical protein